MARSERRAESGQQLGGASLEARNPQRQKAACVDVFCDESAARSSGSPVQDGKRPVIFKIEAVKDEGDD